MNKREELQANDAVWAAFYREGKDLGQIAKEFHCGVYDLSPWLTSPLMGIISQANEEVSNIRGTLRKLDGDSLDAMMEVVGEGPEFKRYNEGKSAMRTWFLRRISAVTGGAA